MITPHFTYKETEVQREYFTSHPNGGRGEILTVYPDLTDFKSCHVLFYIEIIIM